jgi:hypothetical protein
MANPANNAAVLANSFFLMESSSSSRFSPRADPCALVQGKRTWILHSSGDALGFSAATWSILWNQIFCKRSLEIPGCGHCKTMSDFTLRAGNPATTFAQWWVFLWGYRGGTRRAFQEKSIMGRSTRKAARMSEWVLHWEVKQRHIRRSQPTRDAALKDACSELLQGYSVNRISERIYSVNRVVSFRSTRRLASTAGKAS